MKSKARTTLIDYLPLFSHPPFRHLLMGLLVAVATGLLAPPAGYSQADEPDRTIYADVPFEMITPWYKNPKRPVELVDEVVMRGTLRTTTRIWQSTPDRIDRFAFHANAVDIEGTSETTGQRYRINGSFSYDLRDPEVTFNPDGTFTVPDQEWRLRMHMVDPEPARLTSDLFGTTGATAAAVFYDPLPPTPCQRMLAPDGTPSITVNCGNISISYVSVATPYLYRVVSSGGDACIAGQQCVVPDGATLFNGYSGGYRTPLFMQVKAPMSGTWRSVPIAKTVRMFCQTGNRPPLVSGSSVFSGMFIASCRPIYSATEPIRVWAEITYQYYRYPNGNVNSPQLVTLLVNERPFTYRMDERPMDQPPVINNLIVSGVSRINGRCPIGTSCELIDNDILYNGQVGDYDMPLSLHVSATDPEGDPILVEWVCVSGSQVVPITNQGSPNASCTPAYSFPQAVQIYARVSDGANYVWTPFRYLLFMERIN